MYIYIHTFVTFVCDVGRYVKMFILFVGGFQGVKELKKKLDIPKLFQLRFVIRFFD